MIERLHNTMDLMERIVSFLEGLKRLSYIEDYVVTHTIKESEEIIKLVEELKTALWENARDDVKWRYVVKGVRKKKKEFDQ